MDHLDLALEQNGPPVRMAGFAVLSLRTDDFQGEQGQTGTVDVWNTLGYPESALQPIVTMLAMTEV